MPVNGPVLVVNPGSSSLKLSVLAGDDSILAEDEVEARGGVLDVAALERFLGGGVAPGAAGVRVVHGGADLRSPTLIDESVIERIDAVADLAPLHNPPAVAAMRGLRQRLDVPLVACFDTAFHAGLPAAAFTYALPREWRRRWGIRRYGFHGLSHAWASRRAAELLDRDPQDLDLVTCHLGSGASLAAVRGGKSVDTTMGFTPVEGLVMGTRSGSVDPGGLLWLMRHAGVSVEQAERILDTGSGLLALGGSADMRAVLAAEANGDAEAHLAVEVYLHRLRSQIGAMTVSLRRLDAIVFTGGVGEGSAAIRRRCCQGLAVLGLAGALSEPPRDGDGVVSAPDATIGVVIVHAREDRQIAHEVRETVAR
jgi:acetate kinase